MKGVRVNITPQKTCVNLSLQGITYRLDTNMSLPSIQPAEIITHVASANIDRLTDTDSKTFITELNQKSSQFSYVELFGGIPLFAVLFILIPLSGHPYWGPELVVSLSFFIPFIHWLKKVDKKRFQMELHYDMDDKYQQVYQQFNTHFETFSTSSRIWQYLNTKYTNDHKRNAGAAQLVNRIPIRNISKNKMPIPHFVTNVAIPSISLRNMTLFFLPERMLIKRGNTFAAVFYKNLHITHHPVRFIESDQLPRDAEVVDYTWSYVNKNGGPDKRFNDNRRLPICAYSEYSFRSGTGFFEIIVTSKKRAMDCFVAFLLQIGELQNRVSH